MLSLLPPGMSCADAAAAEQLLSQSLSSQALRAVGELQQQGPLQAPRQRWGGGGGGPDTPAVQALALAVKQLQRCGMAEDLLPTLLYAPLEVDVLSGEHLGVDQPQGIREGAWGFVLPGGKGLHGLLSRTLAC